ncbi:MAG: acyl-CoA dehydrogenase [Myxococcota bacterium]
MAERSGAILEHPQLRPFLPLLYVAWADQELTDAELEGLRQSVESKPWLTPEARAELARWLDPRDAPSADDLADLLQVVRRTAGTLSPEARCTLTELGLSMMDVDAAADQEGSARTGSALAELEEALGTAGPETCRALLAQHPPPDRRVEDSSEAGFDVQALARLLDGTHAHARDVIREFLADPDHRPAYGLPEREHRERVWRWLQELAQGPLGRFAFPGVTSEDADFGDSLVAFETLGYGDLSLLTKVGVHYGLFGLSLYFLGTERHRALLPKVATAELPGCFAMSEAGHGSNVAEIGTVARYEAEADEIEIHTPDEAARKEWIGNAGLHGRAAVVFAQLEVGGHRHGVHPFLVHLRGEDGEVRPGIRIQDQGHKMGLGGVDNARLWFDRVRIAREDMLDRFASIDPRHGYSSPIASPNKRFFTMLGTLVVGRLSVAAAAVSAAKVGLAIAVRYGSARRQFGPPGGRELRLLDYRTHQRRLLPRLASVYGFHFAVEETRRRYLELLRNQRDSGFEADERARRALESRVAGLKACATWEAVATLQQCRECCGGQGYLSVNRIADLRRDAEVFTTFEGDNVVLLELVAKGLLTGYRQRFEESRFTAILGDLAQRAATTLTEKNPIVARITNEERLRERDFHQALFRAREEEQLRSVALRLKKRIDQGMDTQTAVAEMADHVAALGRVHVERTVLEAFYAKVQTCRDAALAEPLGRLCDLYALHRIEADMAWFLENGYFEPPKARAVRKLVDQLCADVRLEAVALVDAFRIPPTCLGAPIAFGDPAYPEM